MPDKEWKKNGIVHPLGIATSQGWNDIGNLLHLIWKYRVGYVIELGIEQGGLAAMFLARAFANPQFWYTGWEFHPHKIDMRTFLFPNAKDNIKIGDIFSDENVASIRASITGFNGHVLVYCDNGDKPREVKTFAPFLRPGDIIVAHDYCVEIKDEDIVLPPRFERITDESTINTNQIAFIRKA